MLVRFSQDDVPVLRLRTFGSLDLEGDGIPPHGAGLQQSRLALLAAIAAAGDKGIGRESLLALFWPDSDTDRARGSLKQAIYVLRRDLGEDVFAATGDLRLNPARITSDIAEFDAAFQEGDWSRAVASYQGPFLPGIHLGNGEFTRWRDLEEHRLALRYRRALERLAKDADAAGDFAKALDWWRTLAAADPLSAPVTGNLMRALVRSGDRTAAIRQAAVHSQLVRSDLEVEPDPAVGRLANEIRLEAASLASAVPATVDPVRPHPLDASVASIAAPPPARAWTRHLIVGAGLIAATIALLVAPIRSDLDLVRIDLTSAGSSTDQASMAQNLANQIQNRNPVLKLKTPWGYAPQYRIAATVRAVGETLYLTARVTDRSGTELRAVDPIVVPATSAGIGIRRLADQLAIAITASRRRQLVTWAPIAAIPETWEGYQALETALRSWDPPAPPGSIFDLAGAADPTSGTPRVLKALGLTKSGQKLASDSVLDDLAVSSRRLGPWDVAMVEVLRAWNRGDFAEGHAASHRLLDLAPSSEWALIAAYGALHLGRGRETLELLTRVPTGRGWTTRWIDIIREQALMLVGDYAAALVVAEERLRREPESRLFEQFAVKALAALGRVDEVEAICARSLVERLTNQPCGQAVFELRGTGHPEAATRVARRLLAAVKAADTTATEYHQVRAWLAYGAGDWTELGRALADLPPALVAQDRELLPYRALAAAARGDRTAVAALVVQLDPGAILDRAEIAALLNDKDEAVELLARAFRTGHSRSYSLNAKPAFDRLRGYSPYERLVRPVDDPGHRAEFAIR